MDHAKEINDYIQFLQKSQLKPDEFCTEENINDCLLYISQELSALGYPSIYNDATSCPYAINCDIVKFINSTHDLLDKYNNLSQVRRDVEDRNQTLSADFSVLQKKIANLKTCLEQNEQKHCNTLERERQLKEKCEKLLHLLKNEKEEVRKLTSQTQQQKIAYQHELRKSENQVVNMKAKINQILADKNPEKKCTKISSPHLLQRNDGQRGKWQTGNVANMRLEEMYKSVIASYETRCKSLLKELNECYICLRYAQQHVSAMVSPFQDVEATNSSDISEQPLEEICSLVFKCSARQFHKDFEEKFKVLDSKRKESNQMSGNEIKVRNLCFLNNKLSHYEEKMEKYESTEDVDACQCSQEMQKEKESLKLEKEKIAQEKTNLQKEKEAIAAQKFGLFQLEPKPQVPAVSGLQFVPSVSLVTEKKGITTMPSAQELKLHLKGSDPSFSFSKEAEFTPEFKKDSCNHSKLESALLIANSHMGDNLEASSPEGSSFSLPNSGLPNWATNLSNSQNSPPLCASPEANCAFVPTVHGGESALKLTVTDTEQPSAQ